MYETIMVPLDGSAFAEAALPTALGLSKRTGAALHLVTAVAPFASYTNADWESATREWFGRYLEAAAERVREQTEAEVTHALLEGEVTGVLFAEAARIHADLVVMATHGRGAISRAWIGSVADQFARHADSPVLLVRPHEDSASEAEPLSNLGTILVPLDGSDLSEAALAHAIDFGELFDAAYHLVRVVPFPLMVTSPYLPDSIQTNTEIVEDGKKAAAEYLEGHAERMRRRGLRVTAAVLVDTQPGRALIRESTEAGCGSIAMATQGLTGLRRTFLGSTADKVLRGADKPLLLYRPPNAGELKLAAS